jgi:hypothetical protein
MAFRTKEGNIPQVYDRLGVPYRSPFKRNYWIRLVED